MMDLGPHAAFIMAAYAAAIVIVATLIAWVVLDHRAQRRNLGELERGGVARRSKRAGRSAPEPT
jgi:heme exporter protein D